MTTPTPMPLHPRIVCFPDGFAEGCGTWFTPDQNAAALPEGVAYVPEVRVVPEDVARACRALRGVWMGPYADMMESLAARLAEVEAGIAYTRHTDTMNDLVLMGLARDEAEAKLAASEAREAKLREALTYIVAHKPTEPPTGPKDSNGYCAWSSYHTARAALQDTAPAKAAAEADHAARIAAQLEVG